MKIRLEFKLEDFWIGVFWKKVKEHYDYEYGEFYAQGRLDIWICLIPCFPIHFILGKRLWSEEQ